MSRDSSDDNPSSPRTTIVGGRPPEGPSKALPVPTGLQRLLRMGAAEPELASLLLERRDATADVVSVPLTPTERAILNTIPNVQLRAMMSSLADARPSKATRRLATAAVLLLGGASLAACEDGAENAEPVERPQEQWEMAPTGIAPDVPPDRPDVNLMQTEGGAEPDEPAVPEPEPTDPNTIPELDEPEVVPQEEHQEIPVTRGIMSDIPPDRAEDNEMMRSGGAAPDLPDEE